jgi:Mce-associated membrane protein
VPSQVPVRRPRVAGLRHPEAPADRPTDENQNETTQVIPRIAETAPIERIPAEPAPAAPDAPGSVTAEPVSADSEQAVEAPPRERKFKPKPSARRRSEPVEPAEPVADAVPVPAADAEPAEVSVDPVDHPAGRTRSRLLVPVVLAVIAVLIGGLATWFGLEWSNLRDGSVAQNTALTDSATTSEVSGQVTSAVNTTFSFDYTNRQKTQKAVQQLLTGEALCQYNQIYRSVLKLAPAEKLVLTTTVQDKGVEMLQGDTARVLLLVQQHDTQAASNQTSDSQSMIAVNAVKQGSAWKISAIDTFNGTNPSCTS